MTLYMKMMWAAHFDEARVQQLEDNFLEPLLVHVSGLKNGEENGDNGKRKLKSVHSYFRHQTWESDCCELRSSSSHPFCGLTKATFWERHDQLQACVNGPIRNGDDELFVFCVAAILIINRQKIMRENHSIDDIIKA